MNEYSKSDFDKCFFSEVFRNYLEIQLKKEAEDKHTEELKKASEANTQEDLPKILEEFNALENKIRSNATLLNKFRIIRAELIHNPDYYEATDKKFADAVISMDLDEEGLNISQEDNL